MNGSNKFGIYAPRKHAARGFSMVELALYLVLAAILSLGIYAKFSSNSTAEQADSLAGDLMSLTGKVKNTYSGNYGTVDNTKLHASNFFKNLSSMSDNAGTVSLNIGGGGTLTVSPGMVNVAGDSVQYVLTLLPDDACVPLANVLMKSATKLSFGTNVVKTPGTPADASKIICANDANTITMVVQ